jgi:dihydrofolate reductase
MIAAVVAKSKNNVIGIDNDLPWDLPLDRAHFREVTHGHAVIMGRKTAESIAARLGHGLPGRHNILVTRDVDYELTGFTVVHDIESAVRAAEGDAYIIGGEQIYKLALPLLDRVYLTEVHAILDGDTFFPELDHSEWTEMERESHKHDDKNQYDYDFVTLDRVH